MGGGHGAEYFLREGDQNVGGGGGIKLCFFLMQVLITFWEQMFFGLEKIFKRKIFPKNFFVP